MHARLMASSWQVWSSHENAVCVSLRLFDDPDDGLSGGVVGGGMGICTQNCMLACPGDSSEICGGANSLVVYVSP
jgi:hypothetical protein